MEDHRSSSKAPNNTSHLNSYSQTPQESVVTAPSTLDTDFMDERSPVKFDNSTDVHCLIRNSLMEDNTSDDSEMKNPPNTPVQTVKPKRSARPIKGNKKNRKVRLQ
ncbi:hypothetical protein KIN20_012413 [Parelaphostrongylus tenuis]|uniref:Uncharacterized protein n=1 Tax=Parelaphostrongylus tenuis TaxID=148309 RepID=A0AAD5ME66_PARTN|nr:hypothetical protein KIN20_012413 [Parelaphostrongylus tenuis]